MEPWIDAASFTCAWRCVILTMPYAHVALMPGWQRLGDENVKLV